MGVLCRYDEGTDHLQPVKGACLRRYEESFSESDSEKTAGSDENPVCSDELLINWFFVVSRKYESAKE